MMEEFGVKFTNAPQIIESIENIWKFGGKENYVTFNVAKESEGLFLANSEDMIIITEESKREIIMRDSKHFFSPLIETNNA